MSFGVKKVQDQAIVVPTSVEKLAEAVHKTAVAVVNHALKQMRELQIEHSKASKEAFVATKQKEASMSSFLNGVSLFR